MNRINWIPKHFTTYIFPLFFIFVMVFGFMYLISIPTLMDNQLIGVIIGALISIVTSLLLYWQQRLDKLQPISRGFIQELNCYKPFLKEWLATYPDANLQSPSLFTIFDLNRPFSTEESLFHIFRKEMYELDSEISQKLFKFFSLIRAAEESRRYIVDHISIGFHPAIQENKMLHIKKNLTEALEMIPEIEQMLYNIERQ